MPKLTFMQPRRDSELFEVYGDGNLVGLVWKSGDHWCADPSSTADPLVISAPTREEAAQALLEDDGEA